MKTVFYEVFFNGQHSRYFETKRAAMKWAKWIEKGNNHARIMQSSNFVYDSKECNSKQIASCDLGYVCDNCPVPG